MNRDVMSHPIHRLCVVLNARVEAANFRLEMRKNRRWGAAWVVCTTTDYSCGDSDVIVSEYPGILKSFSYFQEGIERFREE